MILNYDKKLYLHKLYAINRTLSGLQDPAMSRC